jgi:hypothetical protein
VFRAADGSEQETVHAHYVLGSPTRTAKEHEMLRDARQFAQQIAGGDPRVAPLAHALRLPGSFHCKEITRRSRVLSYNPERVLNLSKAFETLRHSAHGLVTVCEPSPELEKKRWAAEALRVETERVRTASVGKRNSLLNLAAFRLGQIVGAELLAREYVESELRTAALASGLRAGEISATIESGLVAGMSNPRSANGGGLPHGFVERGSSIFKELATGDGVREELVCNNVRVEATTRDAHGQNWGRLLKIVDLDGRQHNLALPAKLFAGDGVEVRKSLLDRGVQIPTSRPARDALNELFQRWTPNRHVLVTDRLGWVDHNCSSFMLGDGSCIGDEACVFQSDTPPPLMSEMGNSGTLQDWRENVSALCTGNPLLILGLSAGLRAHFSNSSLQMEEASISLANRRAARRPFNGSLFRFGVRRRCCKLGVLQETGWKGWL